MRLFLAGVLLALTACASTAQSQGDIAAFGASEADVFDGAPVDGADVGSTQLDAGAAPGSASAAGGTGRGGAAGSPGGASRQATAAAGPISGPGFTKDEIYIGYLTWNDVSNAGTAIGYAVDYGDQEAIAQAIADDINARGGIAGRKVVMVFHDYPTGDLLADGAAADQAACSRFVDDRRVFAAIAVTGPQSEVLPQCLYDHQVTLVANDNIPYPRQWFQQWAPFIYSTANPMTERLVPVWMQRSAALGYFNGWNTTTGAPGTAPVKVGVVRADAPTGVLFRDIVDASLKKFGLGVARDYALSSAFDANGMSTAAFQFRSDGITHVILESLFSILFPQAAESQQFRPRYTFTTANAPLLVQSATPPQQLRGTVGVGYFASYDVDSNVDPGDPSPAAAHCRKIQRAAGNDPNQRESWNLQVKACDAFALIAEAARLQGLGTRTIADGAARIPSLQPAGAFAITFGPGRQDGPGAVRDIAYDSACECFKFVSTTNHPLN